MLRQATWMLAAAALAVSGCLLADSSGGFAANATMTAGGPGGEARDGGDTTDDGTVAEPDGAGAGDAGFGGTGLMCSALPFGCVCGSGEPSQVGACDATSVVKAAGQQGACCASGFRCICVAYECVHVGASCACQLATPGGGARVDDCSAVTGSPSITCCRSYGQCVCSTAACLLTETEVPGCSVQDLLACAAGEQAVTSCEAAGTP